MALHIGHRESIDLDFVVYDELRDAQKNKIKQLSSTYEVIYESNEQLDLFVDGVKVTLFSYWRKPLYPLVSYEQLKLWDMRDIALSKAHTIGRRSEIKDYIDLYVLLSKGLIGIDWLVATAKQKFG